MKKNLLIIMVFLSTPIFGMDYLNQIKRWITQNPSGAPTVPGEQVTQLPTLPADIQVNEVVKQLLNVSGNRDQALTLLSNYAQVNKAIANYVKNNKTEIQGLLDQKFGISLTALASGNYNDPIIRSEANRIISDYLKNPYNPTSIDALFIQEFFRDFIENENIAINNPIITWAAIVTLANSIMQKNYSLAAVILGLLENLYNNNRIELNETNKNQFVDLLKISMKKFGQDKDSKQINTLIINKALKFFGPNFINDVGQVAPQTGTLLNYVKALGNKEAINYLEKINKLNK